MARWLLGAGAAGVEERGEGGNAVFAGAALGEKGLQQLDRARGGGCRERGVAGLARHGADGRVQNGKLATVRALQSIGFDTIASGDSFNDIAMIRASKAGFLFRSTDAIKAANPDVTAYESYADLLAAITAAL